MAMIRRNLLVIILAFLAAAAGAAIGCRMMMPAPAPTADFHALIHREIVLDPEQDRALDRLEAQFAVTRAALEARMRADNAALAAAIDREHDNGPAVAAAIDRTHETMGALQKATLAHVFAMRRLMRPDQTAAFDRIVMQALTGRS